MISEEDFVKQITEIVLHPENQQEWAIEKYKRDETQYLVKRNHKLILDDDEIYNLEYHVVRHPSYCVPVLCFHAWSSDGSMVTDYERIWSIFKSRLNKDTIESMDMYSALTQIDHPVLQTPIWALHPCKTPELLENFAAISQNLVLTFLSTFGPFLGLQLDHFNVPDNNKSV